MPEPGQPLQTYSAAPMRRRRSGFRRHRTYCRSIKWCCQMGVVRIYWPEHGEALRVCRLRSTARSGYSLVDTSCQHASTREQSRCRGEGRRAPRRRRGQRPWQWRAVDTHLHLLPQNTAHSLWAPLNRRLPQKSAAVKRSPAAAAPHTRNDRRALRAQRRFRPMRTTSSAARPWRR